MPSRRTAAAVVPPLPLFFALLLLLAPTPSSPSSTDGNFCGTSWSDASSHCDDRRPCPGGTDDECRSADHVCFADTLCDASLGHGSKFAQEDQQAQYGHLAALVELMRDDPSNFLFCGSWWASAYEGCSLATHCPDGTCGAFGEHCFETECNVQDVLEDELGEDWREEVVGGGADEVRIMARDDPRRNQYCGVDWAQASSKCTRWCRGDDGPDDCPGGQTCFADTVCYYDDDLVPTASPIATPSPSKSPISRYDPSNGSFCGSNWRSAIDNCSPETHCRDEDECNAGHTCFQSLPGCHLTEMLAAEAIGDAVGESLDAQDWLNDPYDARNFMFCGQDWSDASSNCGMDTHCPYSRCTQPGHKCFEHLSYPGSEHCNAHELAKTVAPTWEPTGNPTSDSTPTPSSPPSTVNLPKYSNHVVSKSPTGRPSGRPSGKPTAKPTRHPTRTPSEPPTNIPTKAPVRTVQGLCAETFEQLEQIYTIARECSNVQFCDSGQRCFPVDLASFVKPPSSAPTLSPWEPTSPPTEPPFPFPTLTPSYAVALIHLNDPRSNSPYPTHLHTLPPTRPKGNQPIESQKPTVGEKPVPSETTTKRPTVPKDAQNPKRFYCATSTKELEQSCDSALECNSLTPCPPGLGCLRYDCKNSEQKPPNSAVWNPELCPSRFTGKHSPVGDCQNYFLCDSGFLKASYMCDLGFLFDNRSGECLSEEVVNNSCETIAPQEMASGQNHEKPPNSGAMWNLFPELCPLGFVGKRSPVEEHGSHCQQYYDCDNGFLKNSYVCDLGFLFDNGSGECLSQEVVNSRCEHIAGPDIANGHHQPNRPGGVGNHSSLDDSIYGMEKLQISIEPSTSSAYAINETPANGAHNPNETGGGDSAETGLDELDPSYLPDLCPEGLIGFYAVDIDCATYFECNDSFLVSVHSCSSGFKFDNSGGDCISGELVDSQCHGAPSGVEKEQSHEFAPIGGAPTSPSKGAEASFDETTPPRSELDQPFWSLWFEHENGVNRGKELCCWVAHPWAMLLIIML